MSEINESFAATERIISQRCFIDKDSSLERKMRRDRVTNKNAEET